MSLSTFRLAVVLALVVGLGWSERTQAQFRVPPNPDDASVLQTQTITRPSLGSPGFSSVPDPGYPAPYPPYGGYGGYYPGAVGGALQGVASVTQANAQGVNTLQQARITSQQADQSRLDTRRKLFDEIRYEQANTPGWEDMREAEQRLALRTSRNSPTNADVWSGGSLNSLVANDAKIQRETGLRGPYVPIDPQLLQRINVTDGTVRTGAGLFRAPGGKLTWPIDLADPRYNQDRMDIDRLTAAALKQLENAGSVEAGTMKDLLAAVKTLQAHIDGAIADMTPSEYTSAARYANQLLESSRTLAAPNANKFFNGKLQAKGSNVAEFIYDLDKNGLKIAPATTGDESAYNALLNMLLDYDAGLTRITTR
jgi:hypothetical protein